MVISHCSSIVMPAMKHYVTLSVIFLYRMCWLKGHEAEMKSGMVNIPTSPSRHFSLNPQGRCQGWQGSLNLVCRLVVSKRSWHQLTIFSSPNRDEAYTSLKLPGIWQAPTFCWQNNIASELQLFVKDMKATCKTSLFKSEIIQKQIALLWIFEEVF